jgi:flagellar biosynthesis anti-sigma factor FlgM
MKLSDIYQKMTSMPYVRPGEKSNGPDKKEMSSQVEKQPSLSDKVEFSHQTKSLQNIQKVLEKTPEVRTDRVIAARKVLVDGHRQIKSEALAEEMAKKSIIEVIHTE